MDNITLQNTANNPQQNEVHLLDYLNLLRKHKWLIISCLFITVTTVIIGNHTITPVYQAQSQLVLDKEGGRSIVTGRDLEYLEYESYLSEELTFNTQFKMVTSYPVLELVAINLNLKERYEKQKDLASQQDNFSFLKVTLRENIKTFKETLDTWIESIKTLFPVAPSDTTSQPQPALALTPEEKEKAEMMALVSALKGKIKAEQVIDTRLINISVTDEDPFWAQKIANGVAEGFSQYDISKRLGAAEKFIEWVSLEIEEMKKKLAESEKVFYTFKINKNLFSIKEKQNINVLQIGEPNANYIKIHTQRMEMKARVAELESIMGRRQQRTLGSELVNDPILINLTGDLSDTQIQLNELKTRYKGKHPKITKLTDRMSILNVEFDSKLKEAYKGIMLEDSILKSREVALQQAIKKYEKDAMLTNQKEIQYAVLEREVETNQGIYEIMLNKLKETRINESMGKSSIRLIEPAALPKSPIKPKKKLNIILGIILGLMTGVGLVFLMEYMETNIKTDDDVKRYLQLPVLGIVPEAEKAVK